MKEKRKSCKYRNKTQILKKKKQKKIIQIKQMSYEETNRCRNKAKVLRDTNNKQINAEI